MKSVSTWHKKYWHSSCERLVCVSELKNLGITVNADGDDEQNESECAFRRRR